MIEPSHSPSPAAVTLETLLALECLSDGRFRAHSHQANHTGAVFGGSLLAQALYAAELTASGRAPHSLHAHFHRPAMANNAIDFTVDKIRDGASFSHRRVAARQDERLVFEATVSLQTPEEGFEHQRDWSEIPPSPLSVPTLQAFAELHADRLPSQELDLIGRFGGGLEARVINAEDFLLHKSAPKGRLWIRPTPGGSSPPSRYAAQAFVSDYLMPAAGNLPHVRSTYDPALIALSLDHMIWFHAPSSPTDWLFYEIESPWAAGGRGLSFGRLYTEQGRLVASTAQEQLIRTRSAS